MARGDVFVVGDLVEYRTAYNRPARCGVVVGFGRHSVVVAFEGGSRREIWAMAVGLRPVPVEPVQTGGLP